jgi:PAS domain S-box-containing protein
MLRRPRLTYIALLFLHVLVLAATQHSDVGEILSSSIEIAIAITAAVGCFQASRRSRTLAHAFWLLSGYSFVIWALTPTMSLILERVFHAPGELSHYLLFFLAFLPMLVAVFIFEFRAGEAIRQEVILDALQLLLLVVSAYTFFVLIPSTLYGSDSTHGLRLSLLHIRNILLAAGLTGRALFTRSATNRRLFGTMGAAMSLFAVTTWVGNHPSVFGAAFSNSHWLELGWSLPFVLVAAIANQWNEPDEADQGEWKQQRILTLLLVYGPSVIFPIALFMKIHTVARAQIVVGLGTTLISLVLYTLRLALLQSRQNETIESLAASSARYQSLFERNIAGVYRCTAGGRLVDFNPAFAQMFGYTREELLKMPTSKLYPDGTEEGNRRIEAQKRDASNTRFEVEYVRKDHRPLWVIQDTSIVQNEKGEEVIEGTMIDVTDRHFLEIQLRQAHKMEAVGRLAGGVAHDFNNLLTVIISYSEMLLLNPARGDVVTNYAKEIKSAGIRAAGLTRQLLAFSRQQVLQPQIMNLNVVLDNLGKMLLRLIGEHIQVIMIKAPDLGSVKADIGQIEQVVLNLALNARDAMPQGGTLLVETANLDLTESFVNTHYEAAPGHYIQLTISDTGTGMDAETLSHIFEPFFTTKEQGKGTGLGLATVYGVIKQSGGFISAYSEVGCGTTFKIFLPRVGDAPMEHRVERLSREEHCGTETILVVEDDRALRDLTKSILTARGYRVLTAATPDEVDSACQSLEHSVDLLLTDVVMPVMGGRQIAARVTNICPRVKVLYMSGYASHLISHHEVFEQNVALLQKPFTPSSLTAKVREVLDSSSSAGSSADIS